MQLAQREAWGTIFQFVLDQSFVFVSELSTSSFFIHAEKFTLYFDANLWLVIPFIDIILNEVVRILDRFVINTTAFGFWAGKKKCLSDFYDPPLGLWWCHD